MDDCCSTQTGGEDSSVHLVIVGGGSAAFAAAIRANELGARVTMINEGLPIGGTCVNVGCVPSKTLIRAAEAHHRASHPRFDGIESSSRIEDFGEIIAGKRDLVRELRQAKYLDVVSDLPGVEMVEGRARMLDDRTVEVNRLAIGADRILIATGASPFVPPIPGLEETDYLTNETAFELEELPGSLLVLGGRYIALECAQMFARFGSRVTVLQRSSRILPTETPDITDALAGYLAVEGIEIVTGVSITRIGSQGPGIRVEGIIDGAQKAFEASRILVATGRRPNTDGLGLEEAGIELDARGFVRVDETLQTGGNGVYAAGDVIGEPMFVYTAAYEGALAAENAVTGSSRPRDYTALPWVIFTDPQVAGVGMDEMQAAGEGIDAETAVLPLSHLPRALAARDTRGFIKIVRDRASDRIVGARVLAPEGSELLMEIALAIRHGITAKELASAFHPYLTLSEGVKLAAIAFGKDITKLSCCAT